MLDTFENWLAANTTSPTEEIRNLLMDCWLAAQASVKVNPNEIQAIMREQQGDKTITAFANTLDCSPSYVSSVYNGTRTAGPLLLEALGVVKETKYRRWR